jgi:hypothetical protein
VARKQPVDHHIVVLDRKGGTGEKDGQTPVQKGDSIIWHAKDGFFIVNIDFGDVSPVRDKKPGTIVPGNPVKRVVTGDPGTYPYGTPGRSQKRAGDPEIIVTGGIKRRNIKGKKKAAKKR